MNHSGGYDFAVVSDMGKDFECPICLLLLRDAVELPCSHAFCRICLEMWQENPMEKNAEQLCPSCKMSYDNDQVCENKYVNKLIKTSLKIRCNENKFGCEWTGTILDYDDHKKKCTFKSIICDHPGCDKKILKINQQQHQSECVYRLVQCQHCMLRVQLIELENHFSSCKEYIVACPNKGCPIIMPRKKVPSHTLNECIRQIVECKYEIVGCHQKFQRKTATQHEAEHVVEHMTMLLENFKTTSAELSTVKDRLEIVEEQLHQTEEKLRETTEILEQKICKTEETSMNTDKMIGQNIGKTEEMFSRTNEKFQQTSDHITKVTEEFQSTTVQTNEKLKEINATIEQIKKDSHTKAEELKTFVHTSNEEIIETRCIQNDVQKATEHLKEMDKLCLQLTRCCYSQLVSVNEILWSISSDAEYEKKTFEFDGRYEELKNSPHLWKEMTRLLSDQMKNFSLPYSHADRYNLAIDVMDSNKLYRTTECEFFVKLYISKHKELPLKVFFDPLESRHRAKNNGAFYVAEDLIMFLCEGKLHVAFFLPQWTRMTAKAFLIEPTSKEPIICSNGYIMKKNMLKDMIIIKCVLQE